MYPFDHFITFLPVLDLKATVHFYQDILALPLVRDQGDCKIFRISSSGYIGFCLRSEIPIPSKSIILTLVTNDVDEWFTRMTNNGADVEKPPTYNPKYKIYHAFILDPNGYRIEIQRFDDPLPAE